MKKPSLKKKDLLRCFICGKEIKDPFFYATKKGFGHTICVEFPGKRNFSTSSTIAENKK